MNDYSTNVKEKLNSIISDMGSHPWLFSNNPGRDFMRQDLGKLSFYDAIRLIIGMGKGSTNDELICLLCQAPMCIKETGILLFTMAGACLIVFLVPGLFVLFPGILCGIASHLIEPGLKRLLLLINPVLYSQNCGILLSDRIRSSPRMPCRQMLR